MAQQRVPADPGTNAAIVGHDLVSDGDYVLPETQVLRASEATVKVETRDDATFSVSVEWMDGDGNVLFSEKPTAATDVTRTLLGFAVANDHIRITITNTSPSAQNIIDGGINVH